MPIQPETEGLPEEELPLGPPEETAEGKTQPTYYDDPIDYQQRPDDTDYLNTPEGL